jgi:outer membrane lipoprotein SlyB
MEAILNTYTKRIGTIGILALLGMLAFGGCTPSSEEKAKEQAATTDSATKGAARKPASKTGSSAQAKPASSASKKSCADCGTVISVKEIDEEGKGSGVGVVAGGVTGAIVGNQVGQGTGRDLATIAGVVGGAIAGNKIEQKMKKTRVYDVAVKMDSGEERVLRYKTVPGVAAGDKVRVEGDRVVRQ